MFNFIRGMFDKSATTFDMTWNVPVFASEYDCDSIGSPYLSQSELQMLQRIVAEKISNLESDVAFCKRDASVYGKGSEERDFLFKEASKKQSKINKLSTLQYRLKHKITAKG